MTLLFDKHRSIESPTLAPSDLREVDDAARLYDSDAVIEIGLINNMPDGALEATERQFMRLLKTAAGDKVVRLHCFSFPSVRRSAAVQSRINGLYANISDLRYMKIDGLIVTGAEPRAPHLSEEPYWPALTEIVDWAACNTKSSIWSCLAAHAAVLYLDGIDRQRLETKCSGIYDCAKNSAGNSEHWLVEDTDAILKVSHSRLNGLRPEDLTVRGYDILTQSDEAGVDIFVKQMGSEFVFFQGHPEYDPLSLQREYLRDVGRFLSREQADYPAMPAYYFNSATETALSEFRIRAMAHRTAATMNDRPAMSLRPNLATEPRAAASIVFRNWVDFLARQKTQQS